MNRLFAYPSVQNYTIFRYGPGQNLFMICRHCQDYIPPNSLFCPHCGARLKSRTFLWLRQRGQRFWEYVAIVLILATGMTASLFLSRSLN